jgi:hypothetical protein
MDSYTARLLPYNSVQSCFSFRVGQAPIDLSGSIHDLLSPSVQLCPLETHDGTCLVMIVVVWEGNDAAEAVLMVRVTEPTYLPHRYQRDRQTNENSDVYSYTFSLNIVPGINHILWCSSSPFNFSDSLSTFAYGRPNIWLVPSDPSFSLLYYSTTAVDPPVSTHPITLLLLSWSPLSHSPSRDLLLRLAFSFLVSHPCSPSHAWPQGRLAFFIPLSVACTPGFCKRLPTTYCNHCCSLQ